MGQSPAGAAARDDAGPEARLMKSERRSNLRSLPGTERGKVGLLEFGDHVQVTGEPGDWLRIEARSRGEAFVYRSLLIDAGPETVADPHVSGAVKTGAGSGTPVAQVVWLRPARWRVPRHEKTPWPPGLQERSEMHVGASILPARGNSRPNGRQMSPTRKLCAGVIGAVHRSPERAKVQRVLRHSGNRPETLRDRFSESGTGKWLLPHTIPGTANPEMEPYSLLPK